MSRELVEVIVKLTSAGAQRDSPAHQQLQDCTQRLGIVLERLHPGTSDPELATYAVAHVTPDTAETVLANLRNCDAVDGAYAKPRGEPP